MCLNTNKKKFLLLKYEKMLKYEKKKKFLLLKHEKQNMKMR